MFKDFYDGIRSYSKAWRVIAENRLWYFVLMPGLISLILGACIAYSAYLLHGNVQFLIVEAYPQQWWGYSLMETKE